MNLDTYLETIFSDKQYIKKRNKVAAGIIIKEGDNGEQLLLLIQRSESDHWPLYWEPPRGKCDAGPNESLNHCLKREVKEETNLDVIPIKFIDKFKYTAKKGTVETTQFNFLCKLSDSNQKVKLSKEHKDYKWITTVGESELLVLPEMKKTISKVLGTDKKIIEYPENERTIEKIEETLRKYIGR